MPPGPIHGYKRIPPSNSMVPPYRGPTWSLSIIIYAREQNGLFRERWSCRGIVVWTFHLWFRYRVMMDLARLTFRQVQSSSIRRHNRWDESDYGYKSSLWYIWQEMESTCRVSITEIIWKTKDMESFWGLDLDPIGHWRNWFDGNVHICPSETLPRPTWVSVIPLCHWNWAWEALQSPFPKRTIHYICCQTRPRPAIWHSTISSSWQTPITRRITQDGQIGKWQMESQKSGVGNHGSEWLWQRIRFFSKKSPWKASIFENPPWLREQQQITEPINVAYKRKTSL